MKSLIKKSSLVLSLSLVAASQCWAGWGVIACSNNTGACTWAQGQMTYEMAVDVALSRCNIEYGNCSVRKWEHNSCVEEVAANGNVAQACY